MQPRIKVWKLKKQEIRKAYLEKLQEMERSVERRYEERRDFVGKDAWGTGQDGGECCGKAIGEVNPSILGKTTSLK